MTRLLIASRNRKKVDELRRILTHAGLGGIDVVSLAEVASFPEAPETAASFEGNALAKARDAYAATGLPAVADDSGLQVDALNGMPGVLSARWAGATGETAVRDAANNALLLAQLHDVPDERRAAAFVSACALVWSHGETVVRGEWPGRIARTGRGSHGFGYDPLFVPAGGSRSAAELTPAEKDDASHRGRALRLLIPAVGRLAGR